MDAIKNERKRRENIQSKCENQEKSKNIFCIEVIIKRRKQMDIAELERHLETADVAFIGHCHDCNAPVNVLCCINEDSKIIISGGAMYSPKFGVPPIEHTFFKCDECFKKDRTLRNYVPCDVYSRSVGYLRPVSQWNKGKREEFKQRKEFVID